MLKTKNRSIKNNIISSTVIKRIKYSFKLVITKIKSIRTILLRLIEDTDVGDLEYLKKLEKIRN